MKTTATILIFSIVLLVSCQSDKFYTYQEIQSEIAPYLQENIFNNFESDTLVIYDTSYFNQMSTILNTYQDKLVVEDSVYNNIIMDRLQLIEVQKIQTNQPSIYLPFNVLMDNLKKNGANKKMMVWLENFPKQVEAAKTQLKTPNASHTKVAVEELKSAYIFVANDLTNALARTNQQKEHQQTLENTLFAIKDYLGFLNSKILNEEVQ